MADKVDFGPRIGADPEVFVIAVKGEQFPKNTVVPIFDRVGGTKADPVVVPVKVLRDYIPNPVSEKQFGQYAYQEDGAAFEFNVPACTDAVQFESRVGRFMTYLQSQVLEPKGLMLAPHLNRFGFPGKLMAHPKAGEIGCSPDWCAYQDFNDGKRPPLNATDLGNLRFAGGHLHVQYNYNNVKPKIFCKFMDLMVGLAWMELDRQGERRNFYGMAGIYRPKAYGIEYRTPSNFWLNNEEHRKAGINSMRYIASNVLSLAQSANSSPEQLRTLYKRIPWDDVQYAINKEDVKAGCEIMRYVRGMGVLEFHPYFIEGGELCA